MRGIPLGPVTALLALACATSQGGIAIPAETRGAVFYVQSHSADERELDEQIADVMRSRGLDASATESEGYDYLVTYIDRWQWDMRVYLVDLRIDVRERESRLLVATGRSFQSSMSATGDSHRDVIERVVDVLLAVGPAEPGE
jgi:hypothetical protein